MSEIIKEESAVTNSTPETEPKKDGGIKFFRNCSASLKRFSILLFVINIFAAISFVGIGTVLIGVYAGIELVLLIALPIFTFLIILIVLARFVSALIYGFAEIVEKAEK